MDISKTILGILGLYFVGYCVARGNVFHAVEYRPQGKGGPRQDYIAKVDQQPGQGWEYQVFLPAIKVEETIRGYANNL